jgi:hypothetical protein
MAFSYLSLLGIYVLIFMWILGFTYSFRHRITCMMGMMISMTLGMMSGLGVGTLIGILLPGQFFQASMTSMMAGAVIGFIAGLPISPMAVLDGLLSGLMGGMMGVMFVVMVPAEFINSVFKIMAVVSASILFILFLTMQGEVKFNEKNWKNLFFQKPQPLFLLICLFLLMVHQVQIPTAQAKNDHSKHKLTSTYEKTPFIIEASEFAFSPNPIKVTAGDKYKAICTLPGHQEAGMVSILEVG